MLVAFVEQPTTTFSWNEVYIVRHLRIIIQERSRRSTFHVRKVVWIGLFWLTANRTWVFMSTSTLQTDLSIRSWNTTYGVIRFCIWQFIGETDHTASPILGAYCHSQVIQKLSQLQFICLDSRKIQRTLHLRQLRSLHIFLQKTCTYFADVYLLCRLLGSATLTHVGLTLRWLCDRMEAFLSLDMILQTRSHGVSEWV